MNKTTHLPSFTCHLVLAVLVVTAGPLVARAQPQGALNNMVRSNSSPVLLALISEEPSATTAADLLTVELSGKKSLQLLERAEIAKIYREQGLSAANKDYLRLGQVLGADGLLLLSTLTEGTNKFLQTRLIAVNPGVVLGAVRSPWPVPDPAQWARWLANYFGPCWPKLSVLAKEAVPVSVLNLRSAVRTAESQSLEKELTLLLIHRLAQAREIFVLERQHMREMWFEQQLKGEEDSPFWTGRYLLDGTLDKAGFDRDRVTISARLVAPHGGATTLIEVTGPRQEPAVLVELLVAKVLAGLKLNATNVEWHPLQEAEQFYEEARWASRFGLVREAQMAGESAWALGKRSPEVAALRVQAYTDDIYPEMAGVGFLELPAIPEPARLKPAVRALELFTEGAPLVFTNRTAPDAAWYELGLTALRWSTALLDGFYVAAELRRGNEEQLAELRPLLRAVATLLETNVPLKRISRDSRDVNRVKWEQGGIWFEKPEDSLPMYRRMLEHGFAPEDLPRVAAWSWDDRKRLPGLLKQFVEGLCAVTNPAVRFEGLYLSLLRTPFDAEGGFRQCEAALLAGLWECRQTLFSNSVPASLLSRTEQALLKKYGYRYTFGQHFDREPFTSCRQRLRADYLAHASVWDGAAFKELFGDWHATFSVAEAQALDPPLQDLLQKLRLQSSPDRQAVWALEQLAGQLEKAIGLKPPPAIKTAATQAAPSAGISATGRPLEIAFTPWNLTRPDIKPNRELRWEKALMRGGKLWFLVRYSEHNYDPRDYQTGLVSPDLGSGRCEEITVPARLGRPQSSFEVTDDSLFVLAEARVQRYRFQQRTWEAIPVPVEQGAQLVWLNGRLYVWTADGMLEVEPDSGKVQIVVSTRRRPPANELDSAWGQNSWVYLRSDGRLGVLSTNRCFAFASAGGIWEGQPDLPAEWCSYVHWPGAFFLADAVLFFVPRYNLGQQHLLALWDDTPGTELLLADAMRKESVNARRQTTNSAPRWDWPPAYPLDNSCLLVDRKALWILTPRTRWQFGHATGELVSFPDKRQATLFHFAPDSRQAKAIPVEFSKDGAAADPFEYQSRATLIGRQALMPSRPLWLNTPRGLVVAAQELAGHWLIPRTSLPSSLHSMRESVPSLPTGNRQGEVHPNPQASTGFGPASAPRPATLKP